MVYGRELKASRLPEGPDGTFATFDVVSPSSPGIGTEPSSINSDGVVTGDAADGITPEVGFVRMPDGRLTTFAVPGPSGAFGTAGLSINNAGEIAEFTLILAM